MKVMMTPLVAVMGGLLFLSAGCSDDDEKDTPLTATTITQLVVEDPDFDTLEAAVVAAGLAETLAGPGPFTVFAPTDGAFEALPDGALDALLADQDALTDVLTYHVVGDRVDAATVVTLDEATMLNGDKVSIEVADGKVILNGSVMVTTTDIIADNGIIHVIDSVLLPPEEPQPMTITDIVVDSDDFSTLEAAVVAAGLAETLAGPGPFTVFAPTDDAFDALPDGALDALLADQDALTDVLTYHVVGGQVDAATVVTLDEATMLNGDMVSIAIVDGSVVLNGSVMVTTTDIIADNGIIHVIDSVLLPPEEPQPMTITDIVVDSDDFSTLEAAAVAAGLAETLAGPGPFTVFAPTNDAFDALPDGALDALLADQDALTDVLTYHVVGGQVDAATVVTLDEATMLNGDKISIAVVEGAVVLNGSVMVTTTDIVADNGIIHVIDSVLLPPEEPQPMTITDIVVDNDDFSTLEAAVIAAGLAETLAGPGPFTVFAPTDAAFEALPDGALDALLADRDALTDVLTYHVVGGRVDAATVVTIDEAAMLNGDKVSIAVVDGNVVLNGSVMVTTTDIIAENGIIHVIDGVLLPPE